MNNLEKFINDLSNYWELTPDQVVDRLNRMDESESKNAIDKMVKKYKNELESLGINYDKDGYMKMSSSLKIKTNENY